MINIYAFLNTAIQSPQQDTLSNLGNFFLQPIRYLFHGKSVWIITSKQSLNTEKTVVNAVKEKADHILSSFKRAAASKKHPIPTKRRHFFVSSFHKKDKHVCRLDRYLHRTEPSYQSPYMSKKKTLLRAVLAVVTLIPGLFLGIFVKGLSYCHAKTNRTSHKQVCEIFTPISIKIGDDKNPCSHAKVAKELSAYLRSSKKIKNLNISYDGYTNDAVLKNEIALKIAILHPTRLAQDIIV